MNNLKLVLLIFILAGCKTYYMSTESLKNQLSEIDPEKAREVYDAFHLPLPIPILGTHAVSAVGVPIVTGTHWYNGLTEVQCEDNTKAKWIFSVNYLTMARITERNGRHKIVYFDTMVIQDSLIYASKSHMIHAAIKPPFNINNIVKVELQFRRSKKRPDKT